MDHALLGCSRVCIQVMTQMDLKNVRRSLAAACDNQQHQADQLAKQQSKLDSTSQEAAEAKAQASCAEKARDAEISAGAGLRTDLDTARQRIQELQQQLCKVRAAAARAKLSTNATSPRKPRDKIVIPTQGGYDSAQTVQSSADYGAHSVDMSGLIRQMNASNRKLTRAVKV